MLLIFTDLDGTLLNGDDYRYDAALPVIRQLQAQQIPIIPVTSKTRCEVELLCQEIGLQDGLIVENGSAIFIPKQTRNENNDRLHVLGCSYSEARQGLQQLANRLQCSLTGFAELTDAELAQLTGLTLAGAQQAKKREFTEPFITPQGMTSMRIETTAQSLGFQVVVGDRFSHLIGLNAGKGKAVEWVIKQYQRIHPQTVIQTIGLGNSPNDLALLQAVNFPIIIPGKNGAHPGLKQKGWLVASTPGAQGWATAVKLMLNSIGVD